MSLLDTGPNAVTVYPEIDSTDEDGNHIKVPDLDNPIVVRGRWQASTAEESAYMGQEQVTMYRFISRVFPSGPYGRVEFEDDEWDIIGAPRHRRGSPMTEHYTTYLRKRP